MSENFDEDEYIDKENDPEKVLLVPEDDYVTQDGETKIGDDPIVSTVESRSEFDMKRHDFEMEEKVLDALRKGKLK